MVKHFFLAYTIWNAFGNLENVLTISIQTEGEQAMELASIILANFDITTLVWWLLVGLIAGALASLVMRGSGYGIIGNIIVGLIGAFIGGFLTNLVGLSATGPLGTIVVAFIGACILIALLRFIKSH